MKSCEHTFLDRGLAVPNPRHAFAAKSFARLALRSATRRGKLLGALAFWVFLWLVGGQIALQWAKQSASTDAENSVTVKRQSTDTADKPVLDAGAFQQLLSAAFVLQQHKERQHEKGQPESALGQVLNQAVEIQEQIRNRRSDLQAAATLVAKRIREMTEASGAAVGILDGDNLEYYAATGSASGEVGARAPFELSVSAECLHTGLILRCQNAETDARLRPELCRPLNIQALIAAPILFQTKVAGVLELHFANANSFHEQDVRACQLLATLLAEAVAKEKDSQAEKMLPLDPPAESAAPADTASMRAALEKIKPQLERLAGSMPAASEQGRASFSGANPSSTETACTGCGRRLTENEPFCDTCGTSRQTPSTWGSLWDLQREAEKSGRPQEVEADESSDGLEALPSELEDIVAQFAMGPDYGRPLRGSPAAMPSSPRPTTAAPDTVRANGSGAGAKLKRLPSTPSTSLPHSEVPFGSSASHFNADSESFFPSEPNDSNDSNDVGETEDATATVASQTSDSPWTSAAKTRTWLETEHGGAWLARKWQTQRANIYLATSAVLLLVVLFGWGTSTPSATPANGTSAVSKNPRRKAPAPPQPELSASEKLLVGLGLAEAPAAPAYRGNPDSKVWIDVHTALYYCQGSDLYGKTAGGRFTSQNDAQQDNFQPASRRACN